MKKFTFELQKILNLREFEEKEAKEELGRVISISNKLNADLEQIALDRTQARSNTNLITNASDFIAIEHYVHRLDVKKEDVLTELAQNELLIEKKREIFIEAMKNRKILTKLKEKKLHEWKKQNIKDEESFVDDISTAKFYREQLKKDGVTNDV